MDELLMPMKQACRALGIGETKFRELVDRGEIRVVRIGRAVRVHADDLRTYADRLRGESSVKKD